MQFAKALADNGAAVALVARRADRLEALKEEIEGAGGTRDRDRGRRHRPRRHDARLRRRREGLRHRHHPRQQCRHRAVADARRRGDAGGMAQRARRRSRRGVLLGRRRRARRMLAAKKQGAIVNIASVLGFGVAEGRRGLCGRQGRRRADHQGAGARTRVQGRARQRHRARLVRHRDQRRVSAKRSGRGDQARDPDGPLRQERRSRRRTACCSPPTPAATSPAPPSWSMAGRWCRFQGKETIMDFTLSPEIEDLRLRVRAFIEEHVLPLEADPANFADHENIPHERLEPVREKAKKAGLWAPQSPKEYRRHGAADRRLGGDLRGSGALDLRPARHQLHGARRRQHEPAREGRHAGAEGKVAQARSSTARCARPS